MGKLYNAAGTELEQTAFTALLTENTQPSTWTISEDVYEDSSHIPGSTKHFRTLKYNAGQVLTQAEKDAAYAEATVTAIDPATGPAAGGTVVTMTGTNLHEARGATFGGTAATAFSTSADGTEITCTTPAHAAGAVTVVVDLAAGDVTKTTFFTYS
jgi:hypothetical protein